jgi:hypothetical protein
VTDLAPSICPSDGLRPEALGLGLGVSLHTYLTPTMYEPGLGRGHGGICPASFLPCALAVGLRGLAGPARLGCKLRSVFPVSSSRLGAPSRPGHCSGCPVVELE